eukprot:TRINITY_DN138360_c0_g1_i1.p1 TRINITY_DN138360_c0_g1~~TRINITY_DN138360_c0_g1_i1.p1  ORF type:complete len:261 (+),score=3.66 TRINITY_DN138360_c0_g1_i1:118-783(+)
MQKQAKRAHEVEQEKRIASLKSRKGEIVEEKPKHVNFFEEWEKKASIPNKEYEEEKKKADNRYTIYLGMSSAEATKTKPWYAEVSKPKEPTKDERKSAHFKAKADPLMEMNKLLEVKEKIGELRSGGANSGKERTSSHSHVNLKREEKKKKRKKRLKSIEELRREREAREQQEAAKEKDLLTPKQKEELDERKRAYNSTFTKEFKRAQPKREYKYSKTNLF